MDFETKAPANTLGHDVIFLCNWKIGKSKKKEWGWVSFLVLSKRVKKKGKALKISVYAMSWKIEWQKCSNTKLKILVPQKTSLSLVYTAGMKDFSGVFICLLIFKFLITSELF